jgi:hypothetical protein
MTVALTARGSWTASTTLVGGLLLCGCGLLLCGRGVGLCGRGVGLESDPSSARGAERRAQN